MTLIEATIVFYQRESAARAERAMWLMTKVLRHLKSLHSAHCDCEREIILAQDAAAFWSREAHELFSVRLFVRAFPEFLSKESPCLMLTRNADQY